MMNTPVLPHLSLEGYISNSSVLMVKLFEHFIASDYSQSVAYRHRISSLKYLLHHFSNNNELETNIRKTLTDMYLRYFSSVEIGVFVDEIDPVTDKISIDILTIDHNGVTNTLSKSIGTVNNIISNFDELMEEMNR